MNSYLSELTFLSHSVREEALWRAECLNLIASENVTSPLVSGLLANDLSHRYGDYKGLDLNNRSYQGNRYVLALEEKAHELGKQLFDARFIDLRPLSGHVAGIAVIMALTKPGDTVMELDEGGGHHLSEKLSVCSLINLKNVALPFDAERFNIDLERTEAALRREQPRLLILGSSQFLFPHPVEQLKEITRRVSPSTIILYDASHVLGLTAGKHFQQPLREGADIITSSTHKTLGGPQGGLALTNNSELAEKVGQAIYPAIVTNHHLNRLPALAATFLELLCFGEDYAARVISNAQALAKELRNCGIPVVAESRGFTRSHTVLLQISEWGNGKAVADRLEAGNIIAGGCRLPASLGKYGIRLGSQEMTRYGMTPGDAPLFAKLIAGAIKQEIPADRIKAQVKEVRHRLNKNPFVFSEPTE